MSATTTLHRAGTAPSIGSGKDHRPGLGRLTAVELRKMVNTRSGFWLPIGVALLTVAVALIASANHGGRDATFTHVLHATAQPAAFLLPVMGMLLICGEWSQRTTLTTFTLVPSRWRVIGAKLGASMIVSTIALVVCLLLTVVSAAALGHAPGRHRQPLVAGDRAVAGCSWLRAWSWASRSARRSWSAPRRSSPTCCCRRSGRPSPATSMHWMALLAGSSPHRRWRR